MKMFLLLFSLIGKPAFALSGTDSAGTGTAPTGVTASNNGPLTCNITSATLTGSSTTPGATFSWAGTGTVASFRATGTRVVVTAPGTYILTVTDPATGSTATTSTTVVQTLTVPTGVTASHLGEITCSNNIVYLSGSSTTALAVTYAWTGPNGFTATGQSTTASTPGVYTITATYTPTGCTASATATVSRIFTAPGNVTAMASGSLTCDNASVILTGSSNNSGATYTWTGPNGFSASGETVTTSTVGTYTLTAANGSSAFGCTGTASVTVLSNNAVPANLAISSSSGTSLLTCTNSSIPFTANCSVAGANYGWAGPNGFTATGSNTSVLAPGTYTVTATDPANGCTSTASAVVSQDTTAPAVATTASPSTAQITCDHPTVLLTGSSTTTGVTYGWSGNGVVSTSGGTATVNLAGTYTVTATDPSNGCVATASNTVTKNTSVPVGLTASPSDIISCFTPVIDLQGGSTTPNVTYSWSGPGGYTANTPDAQTDVPGSYTLVVTNTTNGCTSSTGTVVLADTTGCSGTTAVMQEAASGKSMEGFSGDAGKSGDNKAAFFLAVHEFISKTQ